MGEGDLVDIYVVTFVVVAADHRITGDQVFSSIVRGEFSSRDGAVFLDGERIGTIVSAKWDYGVVVPGSGRRS